MKDSISGSCKQVHDTTKSQLLASGLNFIFVEMLSAKVHMFPNFDLVEFLWGQCPSKSSILNVLWSSDNIFGKTENGMRGAVEAPKLPIRFFPYPFIRTLLYTCELKCSLCSQQHGHVINGTLH